MARSRESRPWARDRSDYFAAAYALLGERGHEGLTVPALCDRVGVTKGSFYHHFETLPAFVAGFADHWQGWMVHQFDRLAVHPDPWRRLESAAGWAHLTLTDSERAVRAWSRCEPAMAAALLVPYATCRTANWATFVEVTEDDETGRVLGTGVLALLSGLLYRPRPVDPDHLLLLLGQWYRAAGIEVEWVRVGGRLRLRVMPWQRSPGERLPVPDATPVVLPVRQAPEFASPDTYRNRFFVAAREVLANGGADSLSVAAIVERLDLTKGSFRHHFGTLPNFIRELATEWERLEIARLDQHLTENSPLRRAELLLTDLLVAPEPRDTAWRAWAQSDPTVSRAVDRVDTHHEAALATTIAALTDTTKPALLAEMTLAMSLGLHTWHPPFGSDLVCQVVTDWLRRVVGIDAEVVPASGAASLRIPGRSAGHASI